MGSWQTFLTYFRSLGSKWVLWFFLVFDAIAVVIQLSVPTLSLPQIVYFAFAMIGIAWSGYLVHRDMLRAIPPSSRPAGPMAPNVALSLIEGAEYEYSFQVSTYKTEDGEVVETLTHRYGSSSLPYSELTLHARVENCGDEAVKLLSAAGGGNYDKPFQFMLAKALDKDATALEFPIHLPGRNLLIFDLSAPIHPWCLFTDAQIAARLTGLRNGTETAKLDIELELADGRGKLYATSLSCQLALRPLADMYIQHWREIHRDDLVALALGLRSSEDEKSQNGEGSSDEAASLSSE